MSRIGLALAAIGATLALTAVAQPASETTQRMSPAAQSLSSCLQTSDHMSVLFLIDESSSLGDTDPLNQRVDGLQAALLGLSGLVEFSTAADPPTVEILLSGFDSKIEPDPASFKEGESADWQEVSDANVDDLLDQAEEYAERNTGRDTDYGTALAGARELLAQRSAEITAEGEAPPCKALVWFTDGRYNISDRLPEKDEAAKAEVTYGDETIPLGTPGAGDEAVVAGTRFLCEREGVQDRFVADGVITFAVALSAELDDEASSFLEALTTGAGPGGERCGEELSTATGSYLDVANPEDLFFAFSSLLSSSHPIEETALCPGELCEAGTVEFETVPGLGRFVIEASTRTEDAVLRLRGPNNESADLQPSGEVTQELAGASITQRWINDSTAQVIGEFDSDSSSWVGDWAFAFIGKESATARPAHTVQLFSDLHPELIDGSEAAAVRGETTPIGLQLVDGAGEVAKSDGGLVDAAQLSASVTGPRGGETTPAPVSRTAQGTFLAKVSIPESSSSPYVLLNLTTEFGLGPQTPVAVQGNAFKLPVRLPESYPTLSPLELNLASIEGAGTTSADLTVTGAANSDGCVWIGEPEIDSPGDEEDLTFNITPAATNQENCLEVRAGETETIVVEFSANRAATGTAVASLPVQLTSEQDPEHHEVTLDARFDMAPQPNVAKRLLIFIVLLTIGVLLPIAMLHGLNALGATFAESHRLLYMSEPVVLSQRGLRLTQSSEDAKERFRFRNFEPVPRSEGKVRELDLDEVRLQAIASGSRRDKHLSIFRGPYAVAEASGRQLASGGRVSTRRAWHDDTVIEVPLALAGTWIFVRQSDSAAGSWTDPESDWGDDGEQAPGPGKDIDGTLVVLISDDDIDAGIRLFNDASASLQLHEWAEPEPLEVDAPGVVDRMRSRFESRSPDNETEKDASPDPVDEDDLW